MSTYYFTKKIPSCSVNKDLIQHIENYIIKKAESIYLDDLDDIDVKENIQFSIQDSFGTEDYKSTQYFDRPSFPNDTKEIKIQFKRYAPKHFSIELSFARFAENSTIKITLTDDTAREKVKAIKSEIYDILNAYKTTNFIFHLLISPWGATVIPFIMFALGFCLYQIIKMLGTGQHLQGLLYLSAASLVPLYLISILFKPYITFETQRNKSLSFWYRWFIGALLSFLLFGTLGSYLHWRFLGT
jgi:hypothetical protein